MESVTGIVLWVALAIVLLGWVPAKAARSRAKADEHRDDRFSTSMHIVSVEDATRPGDDGYGSRAMNKTYGANARAQLERDERMQSHNTARLAKLTDERIREIRSLRRAGIRRRRIIVAALAAVTAITFGVSFAVPFSPAWALVPFVMLVAVLVAGVHAGRQAAAWEADVARVKAARRKRAEAKAQSITQGNPDVVPTETLSMDELKKVLRQRAAEQEARRKREAEAKRAEESRARQEAAREAQERKRLEEQRARQAAARAAQAAAAGAGAGAAQAVGADASADAVTAAPRGDAAADAARKAVVRPRRVGADMEQIADPDPLYAEMASAPKASTISSVPELISFSLGQARNKVVEHEPEPLSAPIKSVRQVAVAVEKDAVEPPVESMVDGVPVSVLRGEVLPPADAARTGDAAAETAQGAAGSADSERREPVLVDGRQAFADVEPPAETSDSLGLDVDSVMDRRRG